MTITAEDLKDKRIALVLMGGGAKGAYQVGVWKALWELGIRNFSVVSGTSVGALNGFLIANGDPKKVEEVWRSVIDQGVLQNKSGVWKRIALLVFGYVLCLWPLLIASPLLFFTDFNRIKEISTLEGCLFVLLGVVILDNYWLMKRAAVNGWISPFFVVLRSGVYPFVGFAALVSGVLVLVQSEAGRGAVCWLVVSVFFMLIVTFWMLLFGLRVLKSLLGAVTLFTRESLEREIEALAQDRRFQNCDGPVWATLTKHARYHDPFQIEWTFKGPFYKYSADHWRDDDRPIVDWVPHFINMRLEEDPAWVLCASSALPFTFPSIKRNDTWFVDGGLRDNFPLTPALQDKPDYVIAVAANRMLKAKECFNDTRKAIREKVLVTIEKNWRQFLFADETQKDLVNKIRADWVRHCEQWVNSPDNLFNLPPESPKLGPQYNPDKVVMIRPSRHPSPPIPILDQVRGTMRFEIEYMEQLIELGYSDTKDAIPRH